MALVDWHSLGPVIDNDLSISIGQLNKGKY